MQRACRERQSELHKTRLQLERAMQDLDEAEQEILKDLEFRRLPPYPQLADPGRYNRAC
jgi:hypothetical protein